MNCEECRNLLALYVSGGLDAAESGALRRHLAEGCPGCAGELAALEAAFHQVPLALQPVDVPPRAWGKIEERIAFKAAATGGTDAKKDKEEGKSSRIPWASWVVAATMLLTVGLLYKARSDLVKTTTELREAKEANQKNSMTIMTMLQEVMKGKDLQIKVAEMETQLAELKTKNQAMQASIDLDKKQMMDHMAEMATATSYDMGAGTQSPSAKLFWNKSDGMWMLIASGLKPLPPGMTYELWIINDKGEKIAAGTFAPDGAGRAMHEVKLPENAGTITTAAVTDEPMGGVKNPTGSIQFAGKL